MDRAVNAIVDLEAAGRLGGSHGRWRSNRRSYAEARVDFEQYFAIGRGCVNRARSRLLHETERAEIALALPRGGACHTFGSEALGIGAKQHGADRHAGALVVALREGGDREGLGLNALPTALWRCLAQPLRDVVGRVVG